jgi:hypothetical protein
MVEAHIKTLTSSHELPRKRAYTLSMHRRSLHMMGLHATQNTRSKMSLRGKLCFILHFLFLWYHLDFFVTSFILAKPKVFILCFYCFMDDFSVCTNCVCFQVTKTRTLRKKTLYKKSRTKTHPSKVQDKWNCK